MNGYTTSGNTHKENEICTWKGICNPLFTAAQYTIAKIWKQSRCLSRGVDKKKTCGVLYSVQHYSAITKMAEDLHDGGAGGYRQPMQSDQQSRNRKRRQTTENRNFPCCSFQFNTLLQHRKRNLYKWLIWHIKDVIEKKID